MRPCQNGATCESVKGDYTCLCAPGYTGTHCKQGRSCHCHVVSSFLHQHVVLLLASLSSGVKLAMVTIICFFVISFLTFLSLRPASTVSISYLLLLFSILLTLFPVFSFTAVLPSHSQSSSPPFSLSGYLISLLVFHLPFFPYVQPISACFFLKIPSLQPPLSVRPFFSYPLTSLPRFSSSCFRRPAPSSVSTPTSCLLYTVPSNVQDVLDNAATYSHFTAQQPQ